MFVKIFSLEIKISKRQIQIFKSNEKKCYLLIKSLSTT